jgi:hypothetical protein
VRRLKQAISEATHKRTLLMEFEDVVGHVNRMSRGWANYFSLGPVSKTYNGIDRHITSRIRRWIFLKHKRKCMPPHPKVLHERMGVIWLPGLTKNLPWANA